MDDATTRFCRKCNRPVPPEKWAKYRCIDCAAKAASGRGRLYFNEAGDIVEPDKALYDNAGNRRKPKKTKAGAPTPAPNTAKEVK